MSLHSEGKLVFDNVAIDRQHAILDGIAAWRQGCEADRQLLGIIRAHLDIPAIHLLASSVPHREGAEVGFEPFVEPELCPGTRARTARRVGTDLTRPACAQIPVGSNSTRPRG